MFPKKSYQLTFYFIALVVGWVYWPSLWHMARGDQLFYLAEVAHQKDWFSLAIAGTHLYNCNIIWIKQSIKKNRMAYIEKTKSIFWNNHYHDLMGCIVIGAFL